jgi:hypothetical protein
MLETRKKYLVLHINYLLFLSEFIQNFNVSTNLSKTNTKFCNNPLNGYQAVPCTQADGQKGFNYRTVRLPVRQKGIKIGLLWIL